MGGIAKQSFSNLISIALAFLLGAINTVVLYPMFLGSTRQGLVVAILALSNLVQPLLSMGMQHAVVKFYSSYDKKYDRDALLTAAVVFPLGVILFASLIFWWQYDAIVALVASTNPDMGRYAFMILLIAIATALFEIFYNWLRVQYTTVFGNFLKEFYPRALIGLLIVAYALEYIDFDGFFYALLLGYYLRLAIIIGYNLVVYRPSFRLQLPAGFQKVLVYSLWILLAGVASSFLLDIDKSMLSNLMPVEMVAYYSVALFIATVVELPGRAMFQIVSPMVAAAINNNDANRLKQLLHKSATNLLLVSGLFFLIINLNLTDFYLFIEQPEYQAAFLVVGLISVGKLFSMSMGCINMIIGNSSYYRYVMFFSVFAALLAVGLNLVLIPKIGLLGAAYATLAVMVLTNALKIGVVYFYFKIHPYSKQTLLQLLLIGVLFVVFQWIPFELGPFWAILLRTVAIGVLYMVLAYWLGLLQELLAFARRLGRNFL